MRGTITTSGLQPQSHVGRTALLDQIATLFGVMKELAPWSAVLLLLQLKPGTRKFASLRDADIEVLMARIEAKEAAKASGTEVDLTEVEKVKCRRRVVKHEVCPGMLQVLWIGVARG